MMPLGEMVIEDGGREREAWGRVAKQGPGFLKGNKQTHNRRRREGTREKGKRKEGGRGGEEQGKW